MIVTCKETGRYRKKDPSKPACSSVYHRPFHDDMSHCAQANDTNLVPLPCIPNWPLPGQAPQYIARGGDAVTPLPGDTLVWADDPDYVGRVEWHMIAGIGGWVSSMECLIPENMYLIARKDPEADA